VCVVDRVELLGIDIDVVVIVKAERLNIVTEAIAYSTCCKVDKEWIVEKASIKK
jgi:hypothetical protein